MPTKTIRFGAVLMLFMIGLGCPQFARGENHLAISEAILSKHAILAQGLNSRALNELLSAYQVDLSILENKLELTTAIYNKQKLKIVMTHDRYAGFKEHLKPLDHDTGMQLLIADKQRSAIASHLYEQSLNLETDIAALESLKKHYQQDHDKLPASNDKNPNLSQLVGEMRAVLLDDGEKTESKQIKKLSEAISRFESIKNRDESARSHLTQKGSEATNQLANIHIQLIEKRATSESIQNQMEMFLVLSQDINSLRTEELQLEEFKQDFKFASDQERTTQLELSQLETAHSFLKTKIEELTKMADSLQEEEQHPKE